MAPLGPPGGRRDEPTLPPTNHPYGVVRVCQQWGLSRSTFYAQPGRRVSPPREQAKRGPKTLYTDEVLTAHIRQVLGTSPFLGEGHRKVWARLRAQGIRMSTGTITTERPNQMWGTVRPAR